MSLSRVPVPFEPRSRGTRRRPCDKRWRVVRRTTGRAEKAERQQTAGPERDEVKRRARASSSKKAAPSGSIARFPRLRLAVQYDASAREKSKTKQKQNTHDRLIECNKPRIPTRTLTS